MSDKEDQLKEMLERIHKKIDSSHALNGGFDKLMIIVSNIKEKQEETWDKVDEISRGLHQPDTGLYARVKSIEDSTNNLKKLWDEHMISDEENLNEINENLKEIKNQNREDARITEKLKEISGKDLEKLDSVIKTKSLFREIISKVTWLIVGGTFAAFGKAIWELFSR